MIQEKKRALGRGLESLIPAARTVTQQPGAATAAAALEAANALLDEESGEVLREIRLEEIERSPYQPRRRQDEAALEDLAQSIRAQGVLQPIVLRYIAEYRAEQSAPSNSGLGGPADGAADQPHPSNTSLGGPHDGHGPEAHATHAKIKYQLIAGERRWLASKIAGRETVPAIVRQVSNEQAMELALIENLQREDLDCLEMAFAFERLSREFGLTQEQMAQRTGMDRANIGNYLRLLKLPAEVRTALAQHELSFGHAKELMSIEDPEILVMAARKVIKESLSVRATELLVNHLIYLGPMVGKKQEKPARVVDPNVKAAEQELERSLGCRVKINDHHGKGKIVIQYSSLEDFDRVVEALGK